MEVKYKIWASFITDVATNITFNGGIPIGEIVSEEFNNIIDHFDFEQANNELEGVVNGVIWNSNTGYKTWDFHFARSCNASYDNHYHYYNSKNEESIFQVPKFEMGFIESSATYEIPLVTWLGPIDDSLKCQKESFNMMNKIIKDYNSLNKNYDDSPKLYRLSKELIEVNFIAD